MSFYFKIYYIIDRFLHHRSNGLYLTCTTSSSEHKNCWSHTSSRVVCRLFVFGVLTFVFHASIGGIPGRLRHGILRSLAACGAAFSWSWSHPCLCPTHSNQGHLLYAAFGSLYTNHIEAFGGSSSLSQPACSQSFYRNVYECCHSPRNTATSDSRCAFTVSIAAISLQFCIVVVGRHHIFVFYSMNHVIREYCTLRFRETIPHYQSEKAPSFPMASHSSKS